MACRLPWSTLKRNPNLRQREYRSDPFPGNSLKILMTLKHDLSAAPNHPQTFVKVRSHVSAGGQEPVGFRSTVYAHFRVYTNAEGPEARQ